MPDPALVDLVPPTAAIARLAANPATAAQLATRDAELCDMLSVATLEPRLAPAASALTLLAATRPSRPSIGPQSIGG